MPRDLTPPRIGAAAMLASLLVMAPGLARASAQDLFGYGARGPAMGGAVVALTEGFESIYYNPAGLAAWDARSFAVGYQAAIPDLHASGPFTPEQQQAITGKERSGGIVIGASLPLPLPDPLEHWLYLGMGLYIPDQVLIAAHVPAPYQPTFAVLGNRPNTLAVQLGAAIRVTDWLSVGGGVRIIASLYGSISVAPNVFGNLGSKVSNELLAEYSALVGVTVGPLWGLKLAAAFRDEQRADFALPLTADLGKTFPIAVPDMNIEGTAQFDPRQVSVALSWDPLCWLSAEAGVLWKEWSAFPPPIANTTPSVPAQPPPGFRDTWTTRAGVEARLALSQEWELAGRAGYFFEPTPVPEQRGAHNFLDNDRHVWSLGVGGRFHLPGDGEAEGLSLRADLYVQHHILVERTHHKRAARSAMEATELEANPGYPAVTTGGSLVSMGGVVTVGF